MRLTVEVLDQKTLCWTLLARHDGVGIDAAPAIVGLLRDGLSPLTSIRWNWSRQGAAADQIPPASGRRPSRKTIGRR
ncbi:hypothetical protein [Azospirillum doebereinerae]|uniref:Uncharacterized protein n=1 Tax=Azospirillum doebereinerae TaxID=92933 RepID=A0A3S0XPW9_9PROT|nr:hypothetical protein [Azospirillum doebereinerae]MCG5238457.1 hypothetical protein [Azospirillum doebereinerae]RUQ74539.1 hypothetical protein EJ913_05720 [Azospirillum doebereinerae]